MLVLPQMAKTKWGSLAKYYMELGYPKLKKGEEFYAYVLHLKPSSDVYVDVLCDYCGKLIPKMYKEFITSRKKSPIQKDCCYDCRHLKSKESNVIVYGVESTNQVPEILEKRFATNIERYGEITPSKNKEVQKKVRNTMINRYGVPVPIQNEEIKNKIKNTNIEKYGTENVFASEEIKERIKENNLERIGVEHHTQTEEYWDNYRKTMIELYGVDHPMKLDEFKHKGRETMYLNGTVPKSLQQVYICELLNGTLNYPAHTSSLDIAFVEEKTYLEFHGSGHWLSIKRGDITEEEFNKKERDRRYALYRRGWREIVFISRKDKLPTDETIINLINYAKEYFTSGRSWIEFDFDEGKLKCSQYEIDYDFGEMKSYYMFRKELEENQEVS